MLGNLTGYILSIVGVMFMSVIVDVLLSDHAISKYVKSFMALIVVFVIISPVVKLKNGSLDLNFDNIFQNESMDTALAVKLNEKKRVELEKTIQEKAKDRGITSVLVSVKLNMETYEFKIKSVEILAGSSLSAANKEILTEIVKTCVNVSQDQIVYL